MKVKEEKPPVGPDPGGGPNNVLNSALGDLGDHGGGVGGDLSKQGLTDTDLMLNGADSIKMENPGTPLLDPNPDMPPLSDLGHPDFGPDCKPPMNPYCYPHYNNNLPPNSMPPHQHPGGPHHGMNQGPGPGHPGNYGPSCGPLPPPPPHNNNQSMGPGPGNYGPPPPPTKQQPSTLEAQYMQQQSQIFVFSTKLANTAAEAVCARQFSSIIGFHTSQKATRQFLEKNPYKMNNFGRQYQCNSNMPNDQFGPGSRVGGPNGGGRPNDPNWQPPPPLPPPTTGGGGKKQSKAQQAAAAAAAQQQQQAQQQALQQQQQQQQQQQNQMGGMPGPGPPNMPPDFNPMHPGGPPQWANSPPTKPNQPGYPNYYDSGPGYCGPGPNMGQMGPPGQNPNMRQGGPGDPHGPPPGHPHHPHHQMGGPGPGMPMGPMGHGNPNMGMGNPPGMPGQGPPPPNMQQQPNHRMGPDGGMPGGPCGPMPNVSGAKIPDENLTPQQRMHREEQLAKMRTMQKLLFPENDHPGQGGPHPGGPHPPMPHDNMNYDMPGGGGPMDYMRGPGGPGGPMGPMGPNSNGPPGNFFMDQPGQQQQPQPPQSNMKPGGPPSAGPRSNKGGSIPSPATPLTPTGSSCGAHHRPSPHSPMPNDPLYPGGGGTGASGHSFYPNTGYYSPQLGQVNDVHSPSGTVQRKDSESSEGGKSRKDKSSCSISPTSSAPPSVKEANLMPVPSPQQIQYLNVFEGQELTIQKQPNVGLSEHNSDHSPGIPPNLDMNPSTPSMNNQHQKPSHSAPPTPVSMGLTNPSKSSSDLTSSLNQGNQSGGTKGRPGSVGPVTPKNSTTPNPSPQAPDSRNLSQPGTPLQMNLNDMKNNSGGGPGTNTSSNNNNSSNNNSNSNLNNFGNPPGMGNVPGAPPQQPPPNCNNMNNMKQQQGPMGGPMGLDGPDSMIPLNPNLSGPGTLGTKPNFQSDPISSMVQMSQQLGGNGAPTSGSGMGGNGGYGMNQGPPPNMVNFNTSMHSVQNMDGNGGGGGIAMGGPQTVNNTYVNATMTIQQMNIQNIPPYMSGHGGPMGGHPNGPNPNQGMGTPMGMNPNSGPPVPMNQGMGPMSGPNQMGHPGMGGCGPQMGGMGPGGGMPSHPSHPGMGPGMGPGMNMPGGPMPCGGPMGQNPSQMGPGGMQGMPPGMGGKYGNQPRMGQSVRNSPYRIPNSQQNPRAFGGTNIQVKPNAPNTIQYLPARPPHNQGPPQGPMGQVGTNGPGGRNGPPNIDFLQRFTNPSPGPGPGPVNVNVNMGMNVNVSMGGNRMGPGAYPGPPGPGPNNNGPCGSMPPNSMGRPMMQMMDQGPGGPPGGGLPPQMPPNNGMNNNMNNSMKGPPPFPGHPQGPPSGPGGPENPAYANSFHHFQQQLYSTNNGRNPNMPNVQNNPNNTPPNQAFFK